jgi:signal transduction histidine kinase
MVISCNNEANYFLPRRRPGKILLQLLIIAVITQSVFCIVAASDENNIRVGVFNYEPLTKIHDNESVSGQHIDIIESIALEKDWNLEYVTGSWQENLQYLDSGDIDILLAFPYSVEFSEKYTLTNEIISTDWGVVYTYEGSNIRSMQDLRGKRIAVCRNDYFYTNFKSSIKDPNSSYVFVETLGYNKVLELIDKKEVDAGIISNLHAEIYADDYDVNKISFVISPNDIVFAMPNNLDSEFYQTIEQGIKEIKYEQSIDAKEITNVNTWETPSWLRYSVSFGGGMLLLLIILSIILKNKVEEKTEEINSKNRELEKEIKERKIAEEKLKKYFIELENSNELKDLFTDILRHDLINPATVIKGYIEFLIEEESNQQKKSALHVIERNNTKLIQMIENAAHLAKLESIEELEFQETDLKNVLTEVIKNLKPKLDESGIEIEFNCNEQYLANTNPIIEDVFSNIISNNIKYAPKNSKVKINIHHLNEKEWKICIADSGEGIPDDAKDQVFNRFQRVGKTKIKGTGLGLAIVKRIVELHDGSVGVEDNPEGKGTVFWVILKMASIQ